MHLGKLDLHSLSDGFFGLDGGAMFGVVPRPVWQELQPPDERNRIRLALRPLLVVSGPHRLLIDCGIGDKANAAFADTYRIEKTDTIDASLARAGWSPADVTHVILTHLHFDHCGAATRVASGRVVPNFPRAQHFVQQAEWDLATNPNRRSRAAYLGENFLPLEAAGLLEVVDGDFEPVPGISVRLVPSHTPGLQLVFVHSEGRTALYWSDLLPTRSHIATPYIMGYDLLPLQTMEWKERLVKQALAERWLCFPAHDAELAVGVIEHDGGRYVLRPGGTG
jgi:glyoxylase-like metal-dependent hydrolase (beta-lactamase superfamily II)